MGSVGVAKSEFGKDNRPEMILTLLAQANQVAEAARRMPPTPEDIGMRALQILFSTIFSVILVWVVMKIWKGEWWNDEGPKKDQ